MRLNNMKEDCDMRIRELVHSLRNPLTAIISNLELIDQGYIGKVSSQIKELIHEIYFNARYLDILMKNASDIIKVKNKQDLLCNQIELQQVMDQVLEDVAIVYKEYSQFLKIIFSKDKIILNINEDFFKRFVLVLIIELLKFANEGNKLNIDFSEDKAYILCSIQFNYNQKELYDFKKIFTELFIKPQTKANMLNFNFFHKFMSLYAGSIQLKKDSDKEILEVRFKKDNWE